MFEGELMDGRRRRRIYYTDMVPQLELPVYYV
jgi:hypothetical protein